MQSQWSLPQNGVSSTSCTETEDVIKQTVQQTYERCSLCIVQYEMRSCICCSNKQSLQLPALHASYPPEWHVACFSSHDSSNTSQPHRHLCTCIPLDKFIACVLLAAASSKSVMPLCCNFDSPDTYTPTRRLCHSATSLNVCRQHLAVCVSRSSIHLSKLCVQEQKPMVRNLYVICIHVTACACKLSL